MPRLYELTGREVSERIRSRELTAKEYISSILERIREVEGRVHAFVTVLEEEALKRAEEIDRKADSGRSLGMLCGVAVAVKDNICTRGIRTTCSSRMLEDFVPPYNATVVERLLKEDAIIIGKTNMDEFAMGSTTETSYFGATRNPWNLSFVPGGSSGGSAAAVAAGEAALALGSDTGGSIRCPASYCNVVGLKPTYGLVSRYGLIAYANSLEQIGPMALDAYDCALLLSVISGYDPRDSTSVETPQGDYVKLLDGGVEGFKIGVPSEFFGEGVDARVKECVWRAIHTLEDLGASYEEVSLPSLEYALAAYYIIAMSEASSNLARYDGLRYGYRVEKDSDWSTVYSKSRREGFGAEVRRRIILGTYALSAGYYDQYYLKALRIRTLIKKEFEKALKKFDLLAGPTMPIPPFRIGEKIQSPLELYMCDILTVPANLTGGPAISVPCGLVDELPVGLQLVGRPFREDLLLRTARAYEERAGFGGLRPKL
ncbi:MAG: Aspartyl-tRNA(Asn) amidotransferase subunit A / Glutamyl-tRNA(Gln) amidotransferase subunit A [Candidatus Bathyarchaeota archaeon B26-2]|nr:MAG: Aspartyl-tRNA(Asn) amidotransferase subunit A / Glutamyl-tRNA(Gln) amidotransferase subunit A [Candidatus Bathyarchaeota archaeon B26-2]